MMAGQARYLLRFDDLCPTMALDRWKRFLPLIEEFGIRPILAVVPENCDPELKVAADDPEFWSRMRAMEAAGAMIGLHGYRHLSNSKGRSLVPLHRTSEFAGVREEMQREWIGTGLAILRNHGLNPRIWVAPRHGFDDATLRTVRSAGIGAISDGFARIPFRRGGLTWIPQQVWGPVEKRWGVWTICVHSNTAPDSLVDELFAFVPRHRAQFTSVEEILSEFEAKELGLMERLYCLCSLGRVRISKLTRNLLRRR